MLTYYGIPPEFRASVHSLSVHDMYYECSSTYIYMYILYTMISAALYSFSVSSTNECPSINKSAKERPGNTMNPALSQEFHLFCEQEQLQIHTTLDKNAYCVYGTLKAAVTIV